ncbi:MAG: hypothetical protein AAF066_04670 [Pseudomonadota bacterium]
MSSAETLLRIIEIWLMCGAGVAAVFLTIGIDRIDPAARGAYAYRPLLIPGVLMIWPLVVWRWIILELGQNDEARRYKPPRSSHGIAAAFLAVCIPLTLIVGLQARQEWPADFIPVLLSTSDTKK